MFKGPGKIVQDNKSSSYRVFELTGVNCKCFVLFEVIFLLRLDSLASNSVLVINFTCANLALKTSAANLLNS